MPRSRIRQCLAVGIALSLLLPVGAEAAPTSGWDVEPVRDVVERLLPAKQARQISLHPLSGGRESFTIGATDGGQVRISATGPSAMLAGFNAYLDRVARVDVSWNGDSLNRLPDKLPLPRREIRQDASVANRFALNDTDDGYTGAYRTWADWEREIDVLALHGINQMFVPVGTEAVYLDTFRQFGYSEAELLQWIPQPSHQPWWLLQNMSSFPSAVTADQVRERAELGAKIVRRLRELGITPVLPGYFGTVPPGFAAKVPGARIVPQGGWVGFTRPDWLDPTSAPFADVAAAFYASSTRLLGSSTHYKMDLLHEGGSPGPVPVGAASVAVRDALDAARPGAIWVFLGWQNNPRPDTLAAIDRRRVLIVDGLSDRYADTDRNATWPDTTYAFGSIWNFGGHTTMGANTGVWEDRFWRWRAKAGSPLDGIAVMPEASDNNPAAFDYLTGLAWRSGPVDPKAWFADWAARRYGGTDAFAASAWQTIGRTAYAMPADGWSEAQDGLFAMVPSLTRRTAASWSPESMRYDATAFALALPALLRVDPKLRATSSYRYDLMDVTRQVLSNRSRTLLPRIKAAYDGKDRAELDRLAGIWMRYLGLLDEVTATNRQTMLGPWLADAGSGHSARTLLTVWGHRAGYDAGLGDYANREWSGLISGYYAPRWKAYLDELSAALRDNRAPTSFDWYQRGADWAASSESLPTAPIGDIHAVAGRVLDVLRSEPEPVTATATVDPANVPDGASATVSVRLRNTDPFSVAKQVRVALEAPNGSGLTVREPVVELADLAPNGEATATFSVQASGTATEFFATLTASVTSTPAGRQTSAVRVMRAGPVAGALTRSTNAAVFGQLGDRYLIEGGGNDLWGSTKHFGSIYRRGVLAPGATVTTRVDRQDPSGPWARAGVIASTDLAGNDGRGFLNIAVTPQNGCVFSYDSNNDGTLDRFAQLTGLTAPLWVRLTRVGDTVTGSCSTDGTTWRAAGTTTVPPGATLDAGLFMTAANGGSGTRGAAEFTTFHIS
ncbi:alpha-N-acetylglucosaminidase C-terminal domain-containing protein [Kribbella sp. NBC_01245]|uniref:alpha-N-acetylglucosaminidase n=1 Tax=Kribbella sp. NBC_01245 TaxID=2903578 RepID=UPI002E2B4F26|nr:alpha-N-acetylglucosaminidase [Kribbella sp. NBC_01245]